MTDKRKKVLYFILCFLFVFFFYGLGFRINYQPDIYGRVNASSADLAKLINYDGRFINMFILFLLHRGSFAFFYYASLVISMALMTYTTGRYAIFLQEECFKTDSIPHNIGYIVFFCLLSCLTVANMFSAEFFLYIDMTVAFVLGIFLCVESSLIFVSSLSQKNTRGRVTIFLMMLATAFIYEPISSLFIALTVPHIVVRACSIKDFIIKQIHAGLYYAVPLLIKTFYTIFIANSTRAGFDKAGLAESARQYTPRGTDPGVFILDRITFGMWGYVFFGLVVAMLIAIHIFRAGKYFEIVKCLYISFVICISGTIVFILRLSNDYKPRIYYPLGTFLGLLFTYGILIGAFNLNTLFDGSRYLWLMGGILIFAGIQWISFAQMYADCYVTNYEDRYISKMIGACIDEYEDKSGNSVDNVVFYEDAVRTKYSTGGWCLTQRAYSAWTETETLNMYLDRNYKKGVIDEAIAEYFIGKNWDYFSNDQVIIRGNTAHICKY